MLVNFHHPLTADHLGQIRAVSAVEPGEVVNVVCQFDEDRPLASQATAFVEGALTANQWQEPDLLVALPGHADLAAVVLAEIHGRRGGFPLVIHRRPAAHGDRFEVSEVLNLNAVRRTARTTRSKPRAGH
jgi:hypothetical protein